MIHDVSPVRIAIVGCGNVLGAYLPAIEQLHRQGLAELVALCGREKHRDLPAGWVSAPSTAIMSRCSGAMMSMRSSFSRPCSPMRRWPRRPWKPASTSWSKSRWRRIWRKAESLSRWRERAASIWRVRRLRFSVPPSRPSPADFAEAISAGWSAHAVATAGRGPTGRTGSTRPAAGRSSTSACTT